MLALYTNKLQRLFVNISVVNILYNIETSQATCASSEFRCKDSSCIPYVYRCDDEPDCADSSDEDDLLCNSDDGCNDGRQFYGTFLLLG